MNQTINSTIKLYDADSYASKFDATVVAVTRNNDNTIDIVLDKTLFFPEEGGQNSDTGTISILGCAYLVEHVSIEQRNGVEIIHHRVRKSDEKLTDEDICNFADAKVSGEIDWADRYDKMQNHSGEHILSGIIHNKYGYNNVGFHLGNEVFTMDLDGTFSKEQVADIEDCANTIVYENVPITANYYENKELEEMEFRSKKKFDTAVRIVKIGEYDSCACCAPHVKNTGEVGIVKIIKSENWKGGTRFTVVCGRRAYADYVRKHTLLQELSSKFSTSEDKLFEIIDNLQKSLAKAEYEMAQYATESLYSELIRNAEVKNELADKDGQKEIKVIVFTEISNAQAIRVAVDKAMSVKTDYIFGVLCGDDTSGYRYLMGSRDVDVKDAMAGALDKLNAKGGGNVDMIQGMIRMTKEKIEEIL